MDGNKKSYEQIRQEVAQKVKAEEQQKAAANVAANSTGTRKSNEQIRREVAQKHGVTYTGSNGKTSTTTLERDTGLIAAGYNDRDADSGWNKFLSDQKRKQEELEKKTWFEKAAGWLGNTPDSTLPVANLTTVSKSYANDTSYREPMDKWSEQQRKDFGFLYLTDPEKAWKYAEELNNSIAGAEKETQLTEVQKAATGGFWKGAAHTAGALATAPLGLADYLNYLAESSARGKITENESVTPFEYSQAVSGGISQNLNEQYGTLNEKIPVIGGKGLGDVYSIGTSIVQSAAAGYSGGQFGTLIQFFGSAAASGVVDAKQRGATDKQALAIGTLEGVAEGLAEMIGVDNLLNIGSSATMRELVTNLAKQGIAEGLEEGVTTVLNGFADQLVMQDKSNFNILVRQYTENGMSVKDAKKQAWLDMANDLAFDMLGGFVSGAVHAGPQTAYQTYRMNRIGKSFAQLNLDKADVQDLIDSGLESAPETESHQIAQEIQKQITEGKTPSNYDLARLWQANQQAIAEEEAERAEGAEVLELEEDAQQNAILPGDSVTQKAPVLATEGENVTQIGQSVINQGQNVTQQAFPVTENIQTVTAAPLSVAAQIRQNQTMNGGNTNGTQQQFTEPAGTRFGTAGTGAGASLLSGSGQWLDSAGAGEPAGSMAGRAGQAAQRQKLAQRNAAAVSRINRLGSLRLPRISTADLGLKSGTDAKNIRLVPQEHWDPEMEQLAERVYQETGKTVSYVMGRIQVRGKDGRVRNVKGVTYDDKIVVRADHTQFSMEQIADHEAYHGRVEWNNAWRPGWLNQEIRRHIVENFSWEEFEAVVTKYVEAMAGVYDTGENLTGEDYEALMRQIQEEVFADAYAGINAFGAGADRFTSAVNEKMEQLGLGRYQAEEQANGVRETAGPPDGVRYSTEDADLSRVAENYSGKSLVDEPSVYSYGFLTSQPDMNVVMLPDVNSIRGADGKINTATIVETGMENALSVGTERAGKVYVTNRYTGRELWVTAAAIRHGLNGTTNRMLTNARLGTVIGEIVQNAIPVNALHNTANNVDGAYAMVGYATDSMGRKFIAIVTVEQRTNTVADISSFDMTHAISGRQKRDKQVDTKSQGVNPSMLASDKGRQADTKSQGVNLIKSSFKISIADVLDDVKEVYQSILSQDVLSNLGESRNLEGHYSDRVRYSYDAVNEGADNSDDYLHMTDEEFQERYGLKLRAVDEVENMPESQTFGENRAKERPKELFSVDDDGTGSEFQYLKWERRQRGIEKAKARNAEKQAVRKSVKDPVAESKPILAKRELRETVMNIFSIPEGSRAELGGMIDSYADRLLKNGSLTEEDRQHFFDRMYDSGVMTVPAEDYFSQGREILKGGRVYVPESVRIDFGNDWNEIRRRAFGARIYFTSDPNAGGIDAWNHELAEELPGLFDSEETDLRSILERIVEIAEEGQDEKMSLAQYTAMLAQQEYISEDEFLDNMERQMDWALRTFAEKARLEISLRDRTGRHIAKERAAHKETAQRQQARKELRELQEKTMKTLRWLNKNRNRAPEELRAAWDEVLGDIDLYAIGAADEMRWSNKYNATWKDLAQMYKDAQSHDPNFLPSKELEMIVGRLDGTKIEEMDLGALNDLYKAAIGLRTEFYNRNNVVNDEMNRLFAEVYRDAKGEIESAPGGYSGKAMDKLLNLEQLTPMNVLQRMGGWDPDGAFYSMAKQLEKGERDMRAYSVKAQKMLQEFLTENADWVKKADGQGKDGIWYEVEIPELVALELGKKPQFGATIKVSMTPAQKVHLYLESKNVDNLRHMTGGRTFADKKLYSEGKRQEALAQGKTVRMAPETVKALVSDLTEQEMELARLLEQYYNSFATGEINRISNILYGYDKAMGKNYAPIYTNRNYTKTEFGVFDQTAEGVGNLKGRQYAVNPSYNISAFDAFERHVDQTARFVGMAIPARNWTTLMNWREKNNSTGDVITHKWGEEGKRYITDLINTLQAGESIKTDAISSALSKLQSTYITAIFGANPSIVLKQLGSIPLASAYLNVQNVPTPVQIKSIDRELIGKYTQDLAWRTMGYATPETRQLKENPNWTETNKFYKFTFGGGAITAMDGWAASVLWPWAENKVRRDYPDLELGTQEQIEKGESPFYKKVAELFEDALSRSQSTSDEIHQSSLRKSKNPITKAFTMFRSDAAQTYNTLRQKIGEAQYYARTGAKPMVQEAAKKAVGAAVISLLLNAMWAESINFLMALWKNKGKYYRDDEEELTFGSVAGEMVSGVLGSFAGIVTGGEEVLEVIGNLLTGEKIYDIETPGIEQLNDLITAVTAAGSSMRDVIAGAVNVAANGGNIGRYFAQNSGKILGSVKDVAETTVMYIPGLPMSGLPVSNIEGYLLGAVKWLSPALGEAYDNLFRDTDKNVLTGAKGRTLQARVGQILRSRKVSKSAETAQVLASLYEADHKAAMPSNTPSSVSVKGEKHILNAYQKQVYETVWNSIVADGLDDIVISESFSSAGDEEKTELLSKLYDYASEMAKAELFDGYEMDGGAEAIRTISKAGLDIAECVEWATESAGLKQADKFRMLQKWDMPESAKKATVGTLIGTDMKTESGKDSQYAKMLEALKQGATVDEYLDMRLSGTNVEDFLELVEGGMDDDIAVELLDDMAGLEEDAPDVAKWRICVDFSDDVEDQLTALFGIMTDAQYQKVEIANSFGVVPDAYVTLQELKPKYDADGNGSYKSEEIRVAIEAMPGNLTKEQKAVLWQLATGSTSAKNNPYSKDVGKKVLEAREAAKAKSGS